MVTSFSRTADPGSASGRTLLRVGYSSLQAANFTDTCFAVDAVPEMPCTDALEHSRVIEVFSETLVIKGVEEWQSG
jgi:hypothetical protein